MTDDARPQADKFKDMAREVEANESEERFETSVAKVASAKRPPRPRAEGKE